MPTNKHAAFRYRALNQCFINRGRRRWTLDELIGAVSDYLFEEFGVDTTISRRTIQGDINVMRSQRPRGFAAPIVCHKGQYFYEDMNFSIEQIPLGAEEVEMLNDALQLMRKLPGLPQLPVLEHLLRRIGVGNVQGFSPAYIQFETNPDVRGLEWLGPLYKAIAEKQVVKIDYHPFTEEPVDIILHPYLLKEWRNRWYIFGRNADNRLWNLALDRIRNVQGMYGMLFLPNDLFDPETWFDEVVGVTKPDKAEPVEVEFETNYLGFCYLDSNPIHRSQQLARVDGDRYFFTLKVYLNHELVNEIIRYGKDLKVLRPEALKRMVKERVEGA